MSEAAENLSAKLGIDTTDFKAGISAANREIRVLESSFRAGAAALGDWSSSASGLESRAKSLTAQMDIQRLKVAALAAEHKRLVEENGENSRAAQDAEIKLNKETETLNKMGAELQTTNTKLQELQTGSSEAAEGVGELGAAADDTSSGVFSLGDALGAIGSVSKLAVTGILAVGAAAVTAVAGIVGLGLNTAAIGERFTDLSNQTGISAERLQELSYVGEIVGTSLETITGAQAKLVRSMAGGEDGTGAQAEAFKALGVSVTDASGNLRNTQTVFDETIDALGGIENPAERDALAMQIFGKSAQELNPLIKAGSDEMARLSEEARTLGAVMSEEDVAAAAAFQDKLDGLKMGFQGVVAQIGLAFLPGLSGVADQAKGYLTQLVDVVNGSGGNLGSVVSGIGGLLGSIAGDIAEQTPQLLNAGLGIINALLDSITQNLPTLLKAGTEIISNLVQFIVAALPDLLNAGVDIILMLVNSIIQNLPMLITAALQAVITLANGLTAALPTLIPSIANLLVVIINTLLQNLPMLIEAALGLIQALADGLIVALPILTAAVPQIVQGISTVLIASLPVIASAAGQILGTLAGGIVSNIPVVLAAFAQLVTNSVQNLLKMPASLLTVGRNFVNGIIDGINNAKGALFDTVSRMASGMVTSLMNSLEIRSPSRKGKAIGENFMLSTALGAQEVMPDVMRAFASMAGQLHAASAAGAAGAVNTGGSVQNTDNSFDIWGNVIINGDTSPGSLGASLKARRF